MAMGSSSVFSVHIHIAYPSQSQCIPWRDMRRRTTVASSPNGNEYKLGTCLTAPEPQATGDPRHHAPLDTPHAARGGPS
eukprot:scaffold138786_cov31-Tisochrysis_lutea.AAC.3